MTPLTPEDLTSIRIGRRLRGYDRRQVDRLLRDVAAYQAALVQERDELRERLGAAEQELVEYRDVKGRVSGMLVRAEQLADEVQTDATRNAEEIVTEARRHAEHEVEHAQKEAAETVAARRDELARLQRDIDRLQMVKGEMRAGYRAFLLSALELLDEYDEPPVDAPPTAESVDKSADVPAS